MMRCWWIILFFIRTAIAQEVYDSYALSVASSDVCSSNGSYLGRNPAILAKQNAWICGTNQILPFGISGLSTNSIFISGKYKSQAYALDFAQQGITGNKEQVISLSAGLRIMQNISFGIKLVSKLMSVPEEDFQISHRIELGILEQFSSKLSSSIHLKIRTSNTVEVFQNTALSMGLRYYLDSKLPIHISIEMSELGPTRIRTGLEYAVGKTLAVRLGWNNNDAALSSGFSYQYKKYRFEMSSAFHNRLGLSYGAGVAMQIKNSTK